MSRLFLTAISAVAPIVSALTFSEHARAEKYQSYSPKQLFSSKILPTRNEMIKNLKETQEFDVLIIGGGATGCGVALDAATRGMNVALVERYDFSSGTSSKSTKLIHGGVRYLERAFLRLDIGEFNLVKEALRDRKYMLESAPHLASELPLMLPMYSWFKGIYFWAGIKVYDLVSLGHSISSSYFASAKKSIEMFPDIKSEGLVGSIVYYDGQHNDSRMNLALAITAVKFGSTISNYSSVQRLLKKIVDGKELVYGAVIKDEITGEEYEVRAKTIVNATGPFTDTTRLQVDPHTSGICKGSTGVHLVLPQKFCPPNVGLLDPETSDGRVLFVLPWEGRVVVGTTDHHCEIIPKPKPTVDEIKFILQEVNKLYRNGITATPSDILSAWSGIRPLVVDPKTVKAGKTSAISRNHVIECKNNTVTISGGKWTTYRSMAEETVNELVKLPQLSTSVGSKSKCFTSNSYPPKLHGAEGWNCYQPETLSRAYGLPKDISQHLSHNYGSESVTIMEMAKSSAPATTNSTETNVISVTRLSSKFPFIEQEVTYACRKEYACKAVDVIARRMRLAFLDSDEAMQALPKVVDLMATELKWDSNRKKTEMKEAVDFLEQEMGILAKKNLIQK